MAEGVGCVVDSENGSFHSQIYHSAPTEKGYSSSNICMETSLCKEISKGRPASWGKRSIQRASKFMRMSMTKRRTAASIAESATKELKSLAEFMPNLSRAFSWRFLCIKRFPCRYCCLSSLSRQAPSDLAMKRAVFAVKNTTNAVSHNRKIT